MDSLRQRFMTLTTPENASDNDDDVYGRLVGDADDDPLADADLLTSTDPDVAVAVRHSAGLV